MFAYEQEIPTSGKSKAVFKRRRACSTCNSGVFFNAGTVAPNLATTLIQMTRFFGPISFSCMINTNKEASESDSNVFYNTGVLI
jgi:hypothetical protein